MAQIPNVVFATGWTNHQIILSRCKTDEERLFYMLYAKRERMEISDVPILPDYPKQRVEPRETKICGSYIKNINPWGNARL